MCSRDRLLSRPCSNSNSEQHSSSNQTDTTQSSKAEIDSKEPASYAWPMLAQQHILQGRLASRAVHRTCLQGFALAAVSSAGSCFQTNRGDVGGASVTDNNWAWFDAPGVSTCLSTTYFRRLKQHIDGLCMLHCQQRPSTTSS